MGEIRCLSSTRMSELVQQANEKGIKKSQIIGVTSSGNGSYFLMYSNDGE